MVAMLATPRNLPVRASVSARAASGILGPTLVAPVVSIALHPLRLPRRGLLDWRRRPSCSAGRLYAVRRRGNRCSI